CQLDCIAEPAEVALCQKPGDGDLARLAPQFMAVLDFSGPFALSKSWIEISAAGNDGQNEEAAADGPVALMPFHGRAIVVTPCITRVVERAGVYQRPIHEVAARIMRVFIIVEDIGDVEFSNCNDHPVSGLLPREPVDVIVDFFAFAAEVYGLPHEHALNSSVGEGRDELVGFAAGKARYAERTAEPKALLNFRIDPEFRARPELQPGVEREIPGFATLVGNKAVRA